MIDSTASGRDPAPPLFESSEDWPTLDVLRLRYIHRAIAHVSGNKTRDALEDPLRRRPGPGAYEALDLGGSQAVVELLGQRLGGAGERGGERRRAAEDGLERGGGAGPYH
jgi:hypothetical protein